MFVYSRNRMECLTIRPWNSSFSPLRRERERERETEGERDEERERQREREMKRERETGVWT